MKVHVLIRFLQISDSLVLIELAKIGSQHVSKVSKANIDMKVHGLIRYLQISD